MTDLGNIYLVVCEGSVEADVIYANTDKAEAEDVCQKECVANASQIAEGDLSVYVATIPINKIRKSGDDPFLTISKEDF